MSLCACVSVCCSKIIIMVADSITDSELFHGSPISRDFSKTRKVTSSKFNKIGFVSCNLTHLCVIQKKCIICV